MYNKDILYEVEHKFNTEWTATEIHFYGATFTPSGSEWIHVHVNPVSEESIGYGPCSETVQVAHITCYASNKVRCAELADMVDAFLSYKKLGPYSTGKTHPVNQGDNARGIFYYRVGTTIKS
jgi:hypothetical protein